MRLRHSVDVKVMEEAYWNIWFSDSLRKKLQVMSYLQHRPLKTLIGANSLASFFPSQLDIAIEKACSNPTC